MSELTCPWCSARFESGPASCPRCGAPSDVQAVADADGWVEAPGVRDMAEVQLGRSRVQIEGIHVPVADVRLADGDSVYSTHDKVLWHDGSVTLSNAKVGGGNGGGGHGTGFKRKTTVVMVAGPGQVAFSDNRPGELIAVPLDGQQVVHVNAHHLLLATGNVDFQNNGTDLWYTTIEQRGDESETEWHYPAMPFREDFRTTDGQPGLVLVHAQGNVFRRDLAAGEEIDVAAHSLLAWQGTKHVLRMDRRGLAHRNRHGAHHLVYVSMVLAGPGRVWIQSGSHGETFEQKAIHNSNHARIADL